MNRQHYSYAHYANRQVAEGFDALRFSGPIGQLLLEGQEALLQRALQPQAGREILDVGTGTGRAAIGLARAGATVVGLDASAEMLEVARERASEAGVTVTFEVGDAHALPFPANHFDAAVSLRVLMHTPDWRRCVGELCRVARHRVVVDFPSLTSVAALESATRHVRRALGRPVESYRVMSERAVAAALRAKGFRVIETHRQFVMPIAFHKAVGSLAMTRVVEGIFAATGVLWLVGSPVTMVAEK